MDTRPTREIPFGRPIIGEPELRAVEEVLNSGILVHGPRAKTFEADFAKFTGARNAVSVSSCTAGMHLVYYTLGLKPGDEVIVPAQTHTATAHAVEFCGARPIFVDAESETGNLDLDAVEAAITERTRVIAVMHFLGYPVRMDRVREIAARHGLFVMEDAALAVGTYYKGEHAGTMGDAGCFSFYPVKHMTTAEGGMILARDNAFAERLQRLKAFGLDRTFDQRKQPGIYDVTDLGFNFRMNEIEAVIGIEQLKRMPGVLAHRHENYDVLAAELADMDEVTIFPERPGKKDADCVNSCYCLSAVLRPDLTHKRPDIVNNLKALGVGSSVYYPMPVPMLTYYREKYNTKDGQFPVARWISDGSISLPVGAHLNADDMRYVAGAFKQAVLESV
jgi:dTDP-4-amino-4,6-dideoxygalactose transaminase